MRQVAPNISARPGVTVYYIFELVCCKNHLINLRKQKERTYTAASQIQAAGHSAKAMGANVKLAEAMAETAKTMGQMNKQMDPMKVAQTMSEFEKQNMRMEMTEETSEHCYSTIKRCSPNESCWVFFSVNDALDDILADSDDESEEQAVITQVLDEIGIEISGKVS